MFQDAIRAFRLNTEKNLLPTVSSNCVHKVDSLVLNMSGFTANESANLASAITSSSSKEFELNKLKGLSPASLREVGSGSFTRSLILWALLERLIGYHSRNCESVENHSSEYVETSELPSLHRDIAISELDLSVRSRNVLNREGIYTLFELSQIPTSNLMAMPNLGIRSVNELVELLKKMGLQSNNAFENDPASILTSAIALEKLNLSTRTYNALKREKIDNLIQLSSLSESELRDIRNFGEKSITEVKELIEKYALDDDQESDSSTDRTVESAQSLFLWAKSGIKDELDVLGQELDNFGNLKVDYLTTSNSKLSNEGHLLYIGCDTVNEVYEKLVKQLDGASFEASIEVLILSFDSFRKDLINHKDNYLNGMPIQAQKKSMLSYENSYSDESIDLLKFDEFTLRILGLSEIDNSVYLGKESYFELLDATEEYFIIDRNIWEVIQGVIKFHEKFQTYPNTLGLIIAHHLGNEDVKREIYRELTYLFDTLRPNNAERDLQILQMRIDGATLDEIGKHVGLTRERVRQILVKISPEIMSTIEVLKNGANLKNEAVLDTQFDSIFNKYGAVYKSELAKEIGVGEEEAVKLTPKRFKKYIIDKFPEPTSSLTWSREDCLSALRQAATYYFPIRQADYDHLVNIGEVKGPSVAYMYLKYGQWSELCVEAGVEFFPSLRSEYKRMWSEEELLSYARRFFIEPDTSGSYGSYDVWREQQSDHVPSGVLIRNVFGSWTTVKRKVLESLRIERGVEVQNDF